MNLAMKMTTIKTYSELITFPTFEERFRYLQLDGVVGKSTFGFDRYLNQKFYTSKEWKKIRNEIILRDSGLDLGMEDHEIIGKIYIHHMNPILAEDIVDQTRYLLDPEFLICVSHNTHNAIHYGDESMLPQPLVERRPNDTCPWRL